MGRPSAIPAGTVPDGASGARGAGLSGGHTGDAPITMSCRRAGWG